MKISRFINIDERRLVRRPANLAALVSGSATRSHSVHISNVTGMGCRVEGAYPFDVGDRLLLTMDPIGPLVGSVIWRNADSLGFEFGRPLHPAVLTHIEQTNPGAPASVDKRPRTLHEFAG